jgi:hypothetical protein
MWSDPLTVGGGVSMAYISAPDLLRSKRKVPSASHPAAHLASRPSSVGLSGTFGHIRGLPYRDVAVA